MFSSQKVLALALAIAFVGAAVPRNLGAQELKTEVVPGAPASQALPVARNAQPAQQTTHTSVSLDKDSASSVMHHHYADDAERAHDDLLITEVKSALAQDGISNGYPVEVDADHGTVTLSGVVGSREDIQAAAEDAADVDGVVGVRNLLRTH